MVTKIRARTGWLLIAIVIGISIAPASAMLDPSAVYCEALGYEYIIATTPDGGQVGLCKLPDNQIVEAWSFYQGKVALNRSYCAREGYEAKHVEESEICGSCTVCVLPNGTEVFVSKLMGLSFKESTCGDGACGISENFKICPEDCPSGDIDDYCDGVADRICDPDCEETGKYDPDCQAPAPTPGFLPIVLAVVIILVAITVSVILLRRGKKEE
jgi:putative hemolysin